MALRAVARNLPKVTKATLAKRGKAFAALATDWAAIVGPSLADATLPERLNTPTGAGAEIGGALTVRVAGGAAMELQHMAPQLIERINAYLGYRAVSRLKLLQAPLPGVRKLPPPAPRPVDPASRAAVAAEVADIDDPDLRASLTKLGLALKSARGGRT